MGDNVGAINVPTLSPEELGCHDVHPSDNISGPKLSLGSLMGRFGP